MKEADWVSKRRRHETVHAWQFDHRTEKSLMQPLCRGGLASDLVCREPGAVAVDFWPRPPAAAPLRSERS
jgi:hypothetical protein